MGSKILLVLAVACLSSGIVSAVTDKVVCYFGSWATYRSGNGQFSINDIDPKLCTHLIYTFVGISQDGKVQILDQNLVTNRRDFATFNSLKQQNPKLKTLVAIGGWNEGSLSYSNVAASPTLRAILIQSALNLVRGQGFDGFDIDWEYPGQRGGAAADIKNYVALIKEFRQAFDKYGLLLTAAVAASSSSVDLSYNVPELSKYLDLINVMAYDLHGSWDGVTGQNAPLYASSIDTTAAAKLLNVQAAIQGWISRGADPQKIALGLGVYGRSYTLSSSANTALGAPVSGAGNPGPYTSESGMLGYNEICELQLQGGWTTVWDDKQKVPYAYKGNQWVGYDDPRSIAIKVEFAKSLNLGAVMIWSIETEDFRGICGPKYPILNAINTALGTSSGSNDDPPAANETPSNGGAANGNDPAADAPAPPVVDAPAPPAANDTPGSSTGALCTKAGYVRDPSNCNVFYQCLLVGSSYVPLRQQCSAGLYFDESANSCNWPQLVSGC